MVVLLESFWIRIISLTGQLTACGDAVVTDLCFRLHFPVHRFPLPFYTVLRPEIFLGLTWHLIRSTDLQTVERQIPQTLSSLQPDFTLGVTTYFLDHAGRRSESSFPGMLWATVHQ